MSRHEFGRGRLVMADHHGNVIWEGECAGMTFHDEVSPVPDPVADPPRTATLMLENFEIVRMRASHRILHAVLGNPYQLKRAGRSRRKRARR